MEYGQTTHNVPAVYSSLVTRTRALRGIGPQERDQDRQTVGKAWHGNKAQRDDPAIWNPESL
jgi:hypothetical protein